MNKNKQPKYETKPNVSADNTFGYINSINNYDDINPKLKKKKRLIKTFIILFTSILLTNSIPLFNYPIAKCFQFIVENTLTRTYNDNFDCIKIECDNIGSDEIGFFSPICYEYTFTTQNLPNEEIVVSVLKNSLLNTNKWRTNYLSLKYNTQSEEKLTQLLQPIYSNVLVYIEPWILSQKHNINNMSFEEYFCNCLSDSNVFIVTTNLHGNKNDDLNNLLTVLKENNISIDSIDIYYTDEKIEKSWINKGEMASHSIVHGSVFFENYEIEQCFWNYNNQETEEKPF